MFYLFVHPNNLISGQTETIDLADQRSRSDRSQKMFRRSNVDKSMHSLIDVDGLPNVGQVGLVFYSSYWNIIFFGIKVDQLSDNWLSDYTTKWTLLLHLWWGNKFHKNLLTEGFWTCYCWLCCCWCEKQEASSKGKWTTCWLVDTCRAMSQKIWLLV